MSAVAPPTLMKIFSLWKLEILNCLLAIAMLGSMYGILQHYDGQRVPDWDIPINLSTLIALITVVFRASLVLILAELIGQAKWKYFVGTTRQGPPIRRLIETSRFNDASQGFFGAIKLIPTVMWHPDSLLAIMVMVISLGTGAFVQQAVQTRSCQFSRHSIDAYLPISRNITGKESSGIWGTSNLVAAISSALAPDNNEVGSPISAGCFTGNCTFQNAIGGFYNTIGVCSSCTDTSPLIKTTQQTEPEPQLNTMYFTKDFTLPIGLSIQAYFDNKSDLATSFLRVSSIRSPNGEALNLTRLGNWTGDLDWAGNLVSPEMSALSQWAFANVTVLTSNWLRTSLGFTESLAVTCTLYPCLRTYNASVTMGKLDEVLIKTVPLAPNGINNSIREVLLTTPSWLDPDYMSPYTTSDASLQAVQSPCLANATIWTKDNISSTTEKQHLLLLQADPGPKRTRHVKTENIIAPTDCIYSMNMATWKDIMLSMVVTTFNGSCFAYKIHADGTIIDCERSYWLSSFFNSDGLTTFDISERFQSLADRFSNKIRMGLLEDPDYIFGQTIQTTVCVNIGYNWLMFPTVLVFITTGLLGWTLFRNWRCRGREIVWKTSVLPFLFYSERFVVHNDEDMPMLDESTTSSRGATKEVLMDLDQMQSEAKKQMVRFNVLD